MAYPKLSLCFLNFQLESVESLKCTLMNFLASICIQEGRINFCHYCITFEPRMFVIE